MNTPLVMLQKAWAAGAWMFLIRSPFLIIGCSYTTLSEISNYYSLGLFHNVSFVLPSAPHPWPVMADDCPFLSLVLPEFSSF